MGGLQPDIPHIEEHVSKVECVGLQTQQKLLDIKAAAAAVGIHNLSVVHNSVTTGVMIKTAESLQNHASVPASMHDPLDGFTQCTWRLRPSCSVGCM
jgi:translation elongation factor EF-Tu-like GTPase